MACEKKKTAIVVLTKCFEDMEFAVTVDVLRRAGVEVTVAGLDGAGPVQSMNRVCVTPDETFCAAFQKGPFDAVILLGGPGVKALCKSSQVGCLLKQQEKNCGVIAAIENAPSVMKNNQVGFGKKVTSHPCIKAELACGYHYQDGQKVVTDGSIITARGPGTSIEFALAIVSKLLGQCASGTVADAIQFF